MRPGSRVIISLEEPTDFGCWGNLNMAKAAVLAIHSNNEARHRLVARSLAANPRPSMSSSSAGAVTQSLVNQKLLEIPQAQAAHMDARSRGVPVAHLLCEHRALPRAKILSPIA